MLTASLLVAVVTISGHLRGGQWVRWVVALGLVGYIVSGEERLQRFTTLQDTVGAEASRRVLRDDAALRHVPPG